MLLSLSPTAPSLRHQAQGTKSGHAMLSRMGVGASWAAHATCKSPL